MCELYTQHEHREADLDIYPRKLLIELAPGLRLCDFAMSYEGTELSIGEGGQPFSCFLKSSMRRRRARGPDILEAGNSSSEVGGPRNTTTARHGIVIHDLRLHLSYSFHFNL